MTPSDKDKAIEWCGNALVESDDGRKLWDSLLAEVQTIRTTGGYIDQAQVGQTLRYRIMLFHPEGETDLAEGLAGLPT